MFPATFHPVNAEILFDSPTCVQVCIRGRVFRDLRLLASISTVIAQYSLSDRRIMPFRDVEQQDIELHETQFDPQVHTDAIDWADSASQTDKKASEMNEAATQVTDMGKELAKGKATISHSDWTRHTTHATCRMTFLSETKLGDVWCLEPFAGQSLFGGASPHAHAHIRETNDRLAHLIRPRVLADRSRITTFVVHGIPTERASLSFYVDHPSGSLERITKHIPWKSVYFDALKVARNIQSESKTWNLSTTFTDQSSDEPLFPVPKPRGISVNYALPVWEVASSNNSAKDLSKDTVYDLRIELREVKAVSSDPLIIEGDMLLDYVFGPAEDQNEDAAREVDKRSFDAARDDAQSNTVHDATTAGADRTADLITRGSCPECPFEDECCVSAARRRAGHDGIWVRAIRRMTGRSPHQTEPDDSDVATTAVTADQVPVRPQCAHISHEPSLDTME